MTHSTQYTIAILALTLATAASCVGSDEKTVHCANHPNYGMDCMAAEGQQGRFVCDTSDNLVCLVTSTPNGTGGNAGTGGTQGDSGTGGNDNTGGTGGTQPQCAIAATCPGQDTFCQTKTCVAGVCGFDYQPNGTIATGYEDPGTCKQTQCDGAGNPKVVIDNTNLPPDELCTKGECNAGTPSKSNKSNGTSCGSGLTCHEGSCTGCSTPSNCPGTDTFCQTRTCVAGACGFDYAANGTAVTDSNPGYCKKTQCDGAGNTKDVNDNSNPPPDTACTIGECNAGTPSQSNKSNGTSCGSSMTCFEGSCTGCATSTNCPGTDTFCRTRTCTSGTCGFDYKANGTAATGYPDPGYCKKTQCDGSGGTKDVNDDNNRPSNTPCTTYTCNSGSLTVTNKPVGATCTSGVCNAASQCVQCLTASDCGAALPCQDRSCINNVCGVSNKTNGTSCGVTAASTCDAGACKTTPLWSPITVGYGHACAITSAGAVKCWGTYWSQTYVATQVPGLSSGFVAVSAGANHTCAIKNDSTIHCWGLDSQGQLGNGAADNNEGNPTLVSGSAKTFVTIASGNSHSCALDHEGAVWCWGRNDEGEIGDGTNANKLQPTQINHVGPFASIAAGGLSSSAILAAGGIMSWGQGASGVLGTGNTDNMNRPTASSFTSAEFSSADIAYYHACAVTTGAAVKCWGSNGGGKLGNNSSTASLIPVDVSGLTSGVKSVSTGQSHSCAVTTAGAVRCWGYNDYGNLGNNTTTNSPIPVQVNGLTSGVSHVAVGISSACAYLTSGSVRCWGSNANGELGNNSTTNSSVPVNVQNFP